MGRLFDYYLRQAADRTRQLFPARYRSLPGHPGAGTEPSVADQIAARIWFDQEISNLVAVSAIMTDHGYPRHATLLAGEVVHYLHEFGRYEEATSIIERAIHAARDLGDSRSEARALTALGYVAMQQGRHAQAAIHLGLALGLFGEIADQKGAADAHGTLGVVARRLGRYEQAAAHQQQALALYSEIGYEWGQAGTLVRLGTIERRRGNLAQAAGHLEQAVALYRELSDLTRHAEALTRFRRRRMRARPPSASRAPSPGGDPAVPAD